MRKLLLFFLLCFLLLFSSVVYAVEPVLFFSDITSGPKKGLKDGLGSGAIVTIWGKNLGAAQGASKIYAGGVEAAHVYYWGNADGSALAGPAKLYESHGMQTISFSIAATAADGSGNIYVVINGVQSNKLPFTIRAGNIYHVKATGNNSSGNGSWSNPWRIMAHAVNQNLRGSPVNAGDIIYVNEGVQELDDGLVPRDINGTANSPISIIAYPGARVIIQSSRGGGIGNYNKNQRYWNFSKFIVKTTGTGIDTFKGMRAIGNEITNYLGGCATGQGGAIAGGNGNNPNNPSKDVIGGGIKAFGNYIHDFGCDTTSKLHHVFYITNRGGYSVEAYEVGWNYLKDNKAHHGLHVYDEGICGDFSGIMRIHDNVVVNQVGIGVGVAARGANPCFTMPVEIYNNLFINNGLEISTCSGHTSVASFNLAENRSNIKFYNNTIYGYGDASEGSGKFLEVEAFGGTLEFMNNIVVDTKNFPYTSGTSLAPAVHSNNLWYNGGDSNPVNPPSWDTSPITSDPFFVNPSALDFHLQQNSPAINKGKKVEGVTRDIDGNPRSSGKGYDIGAYEYMDKSKMQNNKNSK